MRPELALQRLPGEAADFGLGLAPAAGAAADEVAVDPVALDEVFEHAGEEGDVAAGVDLEVVVGDLGAEQGALGDRGNPVAVQPRLLIGIDDEDLGSGFFGVVQILGGHRLIVGQVGADQNDQVGADPVRVGAGGGGTADGGAEAGGAGRVADAGAGIDMIGAEEARDFLVGVVGFVGEAARGHIPGQALGIDFAQGGGDASDGFIPGDDAEAFVALGAHHRRRQASHLAQLPLGESAQSGGILEQVRVHGGHGVEPQQLQTHGAEVNALHRPVVHAAGAQRAAVATAIAQDAKGVAQAVAVLPDRIQNVSVIVGVLLVETVGYEADPVPLVDLLGPVFGKLCHRGLLPHDVVLVAGFPCVAANWRMSRAKWFPTD